MASGSSLTGLGDDVINNSGTFDIRYPGNGSTSFMSWTKTANPATLFRNTGTVRKTGGTVSLVIDGINFDQEGLVDVKAGEIAFDATTMILNGPVHLAAGTTIAINEGSAVTLGNGNRITGDGSVNASPQGVAPATMNGTIHIGGPGGVTGNLDIRSGVLTGALAISTEGRGEAFWSGGTVAGTIAVTVGGRLAIVSPNFGGHSLDASTGGGVIANSGTVTLVGGSITGIAGSGTAIDNSGVFDIPTGDNSDSIVMSTGGNAGAPLAIHNRAGGILRKTGGNASITLDHVNVDNAGKLRVFNGTLVVGGDYNQAAGGHLEVDIAGPDPGTRYGVLGVGGTATLSGSLDIDFTHNYEPNLGDTFQTVNYGQNASTFTSIDTINLASALALNPAYNAAGLKLMVQPPANGGPIVVSNIVVTLTSLSTARLEFDTAPMTSGVVQYGPATATGEVPSGAPSVAFGPGSHHIVTLPNLQAGIAYSGAIVTDPSGPFGSGTATFVLNVPLALDGDLNNDGVFDASDLNLAMDIFLVRIAPTPQQLDRGDVIPRDPLHHGDGEINSDDINWLFRHLLGLE